MSVIGRLVEFVAFKTGRLRWLWVKLQTPSSYRYADFLRIHGGFQHIGAQSRVNPDALITDPYLVRIGRNCAIAKSDLIGHNGLVGIVQNILPGEVIDSVGQIDIRDNSFIGHGSIILPGVTIGPNAIVAAGSVVVRDVPENCVVGGVPAKVIGRSEDFYQKLVERTKDYPWFTIIKNRKGDFDPELEPLLQKERVDFFFGSHTDN